MQLLCFDGLYSAHLPTWRSKPRDVLSDSPHYPAPSDSGLVPCMQETAKGVQNEITAPHITPCRVLLHEGSYAELTRCPDKAGRARFSANGLESKYFRLGFATVHVAQSFLFPTL